MRALLNWLQTKKIDRAVILDRDVFFQEFRKIHPRYNQTFVDRMEVFLWFMERDPAPWKDIRHAAYIMATAYHETGRNRLNFKQREIRQVSTSTAYRRKIRRWQDRYWNTGYYGRGYVMLTWEDNYRKAKRYVKRDYPYFLKLFEEDTGEVFNPVKDPDQLYHPAIGYSSMVSGMTKGWFTGHSLTAFDNNQDFYYNARRTVNGVFHANKVKTIAKKIEKVLEASIRKGDTNRSWLMRLLGD